MTDDPSHEARALWRDQPTEAPPMTLAHIHARAYQSRIRWRNGREYLAGVFTIAACAWLASRIDAPVTRIGLVMLILGALVAMWQLHRRGAAQALQPADAAQSLAFHRAQLVRQRDALRTVGTWYLAPNVPGLVITLLGQYLAHPDRWVVSLAMAAVVTATFTGVWMLNRWGAHHLQAQIEELDSLGPESV